MRGEIHGYKVARRAPGVSHLLFANDSFMFFKASMTQCSAIKNIFGAYKRIYGQSINFQKSRIVFSPNAEDHLRIYIATELGVSSPLNTGRYLGLPSYR